MHSCWENLSNMFLQQQKKASEVILAPTLCYKEIV